MKNQYFNTLVKKLSKYKNKLIHIDELKRLLRNILDDQYKDTKAYKNIYYLKNRGYLISLRKDLFFVKSPQSQISDDDLLEKFYRKILKKSIKDQLSSQRYIGDLKALEININNYNIPDKIVIINPFKKSHETVILGKKAVFKTFESRSQNIYNQLRKFTYTASIQWISFKVAKLELALLESVHSPDPGEYEYIKQLAKRILKKSWKKLQIPIFEQIIKLGKHHASINRLYKISQAISPNLADQFREIIKKYSFFLEVD